MYVLIAETVKDQLVDVVAPAGIPAHGGEKQRLKCLIQASCLHSHSWALLEDSHPTASTHQRCLEWTPPVISNPHLCKTAASHPVHSPLALHPGFHNPGRTLGPTSKRRQKSQDRNYFFPPLPSILFTAYFWLFPLPKPAASLQKHSSADLCHYLTQEHRFPPAAYLSSCPWCPEAAQWRWSTLLLKSATSSCWHPRWLVCCRDKKHSTASQGLHFSLKKTYIYEK